MTSKPRPNTLAQSLDISLREWIEYYQAHVVMKQVHYRGVPTWKNVLDLWVIQEIIHDTQPEVVVEIGCKFGGTTLWLADQLRAVGKGAVISIDLTEPKISLPDNVRFVQGNSIAPETVMRVRDACEKKRIMLMTDGDHSAEHVLQELRLYAPLVSQGCYFVVEDGIVDVMEWREFTPGPLVAVRSFLEENKQFVADQTREKFIITYAPGGFLKRV